MRVTDVGSADHREDEWRVAERQVRLDEPPTCREKHGEAGQTARPDLPDSRDDQLLLASRSGVVAVRMAGPSERERSQVHEVVPPARQAEATVAAPDRVRRVVERSGNVNVESPHVVDELAEPVKSDDDVGIDLDPKRGPDDLAEGGPG